MSGDAKAKGLRRLRPAGRSTPQFWLLVATVAALVLLGLVMTFSSSFVRSVNESGDAFDIFSRQLQWTLLGIPVLGVVACADYRTLRRWAGPAFAVALLLSALVLVPALGHKVSGARRWFLLGPISVQPSELLKLALPLWVAAVLAGRWSRLRKGDLHGLLLPAVPGIVLAAALVLAGPDLETAALIAAVGGVCLYAAGLPNRVVAFGVGAVAAAGALGIVTSEFRRGRIQAWLDPMTSADGYGYQSLQGLLAMGSGGVFGRGLGQGRGQWLYVPNAHTDFIFAIIGEELGLIGAMSVLGLFVALAVAGTRTARRAPDPFGRLLAAGITWGLLLQAAINIGSVVGLLPVTGVTLPLLSSGGSSLLVTMASLGVLMSIARAGQEATPAVTRQRADSARRTT